METAAYVANLSEDALEVLRKRYLQPGETPEQMWTRVARALAGVEKRYNQASEEHAAHWEREFHRVLASLEFLPAGRTLANDVERGLKVVANCLVLHPEDSLHSIMETKMRAVLCQKAGCQGIGFPWHLLRPAGQITHTVPGVASGPVSFMHTYNEDFDVIKQQNRHGANMGIMRVDHPDILEFIHCKEKEGSFRNFNISVGLTDEFMREVLAASSKPWRCHFAGKEYPLRRIAREPGSFRLSRIEELPEMTAPQLFAEILDCAWRNGEPGCVFLDAVNDANPLPGLGRIECCNPCGEQFLHANDVCNLGSINLEKFHDAKNEDGVAWARLREVTWLAVRMLDNVVDLFEFPDKRVQETCQANRRLGIGVMGLADLLYQIGEAYNSREGRTITDKVMRFIKDQAVLASESLAQEKGPFANWELSSYAREGLPPRRTISMVADVSGGVEPHFMLAYEKKNVLGGARFVFFNKHLRRALEREGIWSEELRDQIVRAGSVQGMLDLPEHLRRTFVTSMDISAMDHVLMQAAVQEHVCNAVSKTVNFPNQATREDVRQAYMLAWTLRCKGITVYRSGSRQVEILSAVTVSAPAPAPVDVTPPVSPMLPEADESAAGSSSLKRSMSPSSGLASQDSLGGSSGGEDEATAKQKKRPRADGTCRDRVCLACNAGQESLRASEGCISCLACGWAKCSM